MAFGWSKKHPRVVSNKITYEIKDGKVLFIQNGVLVYTTLARGKGESVEGFKKRIKRAIDFVKAQSVYVTNASIGANQLNVYNGHEVQLKWEYKDV